MSNLEKYFRWLFIDETDRDLWRERVAIMSEDKDTDPYTVGVQALSEVNRFNLHRVSSKLDDFGKCFSKEKYLQSLKEEL